MLCATSSASSRPRQRRRLGPPRPSPSALELARAPSSICPHCGRNSKTVQGVCADCWGSKGGRQFWLSKQAPRASILDDLEDILGFDPLHPFALVATALLVPALIALVLWTLG